MSVSAETFNDVDPDNSTEVTAKIIDPGVVSYVITIPETADFGILEMPENEDIPHYTFNNFKVEATELNIQSNQGVSIYMKDADDNQFYITQKDVADNPFKISYDIYDSVVDDSNIAGQTALNDPTNTPGTYGYHLCTFMTCTTGKTQDVTLALDQNALYNQELSEIAGDYSGYINFHSALIQIG